MSRGVASGTAQPVQAATPETPVPADATGPITQGEQSSVFSLTGPAPGGTRSAGGRQRIGTRQRDSLQRPDGLAGAPRATGSHPARRTARGADPRRQRAQRTPPGEPGPRPPGPAEPTDLRPAAGTRPDPAAATTSAGTHRGLPRRVRQASIAPQLRTGAQNGTSRHRSPRGAAWHWREERSPEENRDLMSSLQQGWQRGRLDDLEYPTSRPGCAARRPAGPAADRSDGEAP